MVGQSDLLTARRECNGATGRVFFFVFFFFVSFANWFDCSSLTSFTFCSVMLLAVCLDRDRLASLPLFSVFSSTADLAR